MLTLVYPISLSTSTPPKRIHTPIFQLTLLLLLTFTVFSPVKNFDYLAIDDSIHTEGNPRISPLTLDNVLSFWTMPYENAFTPITYTAWALLAHLAKNTPEEIELSKTRMNPEGNKFKPGVFHFGNLLVHLATIVVVYFILLELFPTPWAPLLGSMLFALHPLQVETVCWITGLRDLLAGLFTCTSLLLYFRFLKRTNPKELAYRSPLYLLAFLSFLTAILCKSSALMTPFIAILVAIFYFHRSPQLLFLDLAPWLVLISPVMNVFFGLNDSVALKVVHIPPLPSRFLIAGDAITFYLGKLLFPLHLMMDYGRSPQFVLKLETLYLTALFPIILAIFCFALFFTKKWVWPLVALGIFILGLAPVLGITPFIFQHISTTADRYVYLSLLGASLALAEIVRGIKRTKWTYAVAVLCCLLAVKSWDQVPTWKNNFEIFSQILKHNPKSWLGSNNLGTVYEGRGDYFEAMNLYELSAVLSDIPSAWNNAGAMAVEIKDYTKAKHYFRQAIRSSRGSSWAYHNLAATFMLAGERKEAMKQYELATSRNGQMKHAYKKPIILRKDDGDKSRAG